MALAEDVHDAGVRHVTGKVLVDDSVFDRRRGLGKHPAQPNPYVGPLSGLSYEFGVTSHGYAANPELEAGDAFKQALQQHGIGVAGGVEHGKAGAGPGREPAAGVGQLRADRGAGRADQRAVEQLLRRDAAQAPRRRARHAGLDPGRDQRRARLRPQAPYPRPRQGRLRDRAQGPDVGRSTSASCWRRCSTSPRPTTSTSRCRAPASRARVANRMEGTAAQGRCRAKTGTINGVSALSGYCDDRHGEPIVFSILMNGIGSNYTTARNLRTGWSSRSPSTAASAEASACGACRSSPSPPRSSSSSAG